MKLALDDLEYEFAKKRYPELYAQIEAAEKRTAEAEKRTAEAEKRTAEAEKRMAGLARSFSEYLYQVQAAQGVPLDAIVKSIAEHTGFGMEVIEQWTKEFAG